MQNVTAEEIAAAREKLEQVVKEFSSLADRQTLFIRNNILAAGASLDPGRVSEALDTDYKLKYILTTLAMCYEVAS